MAMAHDGLWCDQFVNRQKALFAIVLVWPNAVELAHRLNARAASLPLPVLQINEHQV